MTVAFMFPGQSSRDPLMFARLRHLAPSETADVLSDASCILERDLAEGYGSDSGIAFDCNRDIQLAVFLANHILLEALERRGVSAAVSLGLSLGEYNHLVHIGALTFEAALRLVDQRGQCYDQGPRGMMASVFPVGTEEVEHVLRSVRDRGVVEIAGYNSPSQQVIGGETEAVLAAMALLEEEHYAQCVAIEQHIPMHTSMFGGVAQSFRPALEAAPWQPATRPYLPNNLGRMIEQPTPADLCDCLAGQVCQPMLWRASIEAVAARYPETTFIEVGPRAVLYNLLRRDWRANRKYRLDAADDPTQSLDELARELARAA